MASEICRPRGQSSRPIALISNRPPPVRGTGGQSGDVSESSEYEPEKIEVVIAFRKPFAFQPKTSPHAEGHNQSNSATQKMRHPATPRRPLRTVDGRIQRP